jgi:NADPH-dependent 2,4-dienoyl-CoA reductase/sulfur reductase-like enzyme
MAAALGLKESGVENILLVDRENTPGGILLQCIHNGFGLHHFKEELTGPEYAERCYDLVSKNKIETLVSTCAVDIIKNDDKLTAILLSEEKGLIEVETKAVILAMGCRERNRGNIAIPGSRPAGIMTAGLAQKLVNRYGYMPGREVVILGSGDIGLIMARRMTWEGARVKAVVEVQSYPGGLNRNIVQCLKDFNIPLYLSHSVSNIIGNKRIEAVEVSPIDEHFEPDKSNKFMLTCDTLLLSVGLIPENELSLKVGVKLDPVTRGPIVDENLMTNIPGIFACGNVLHVHDLVDYVSEESEFCGRSAAKYISGDLKKGREIPLRAGNQVRYILPSKAVAGNNALLSLRCMTPANNMTLKAKTGSTELYSKKFRKIFPSEMIRFEIKDIPDNAEYLEVGFEGGAK